MDESNSLRSKWFACQATLAGLCFLILACWTSPSGAVITLEASDSANTQIHNPGVTAWTDSVVVPDAADRSIVVFVTNAIPAVGLTVNATLDGIAMTRLFSQEKAAGSYTLSGFVLKDPPVGTLELVIYGDDSGTPTIPADAAIAGGHSWAIFSGVDGTVPFEDDGSSAENLAPSTTSSSFSLDASGAGSVLVGAVLYADGTPTSAGGQTLLADFDTLSYTLADARSEYKSASAAGTVTLNWSSMASVAIAKGGVMLRPKDYSGTNCENTPTAAGCPPTGECDPNDVLLLPCEGTVATTQGVEPLENKTLTSSVLLSPVVHGSLSGDAILDEDNFASDSDVKVATQQSTKAYIDARVGGMIGGTSALLSATTIASCNLAYDNATYANIGHCRMPFNATIDKLYVDSDGGSMSGSDAMEIKLLVNNVESSLACTINSSNSFDKCADTTTTVNVSAGDEIAWQLTETGTVGARFGVTARVTGR